MSGVSTLRRNPVARCLAFPGYQTGTVLAAAGIPKILRHLTMLAYKARMTTDMTNQSTFRPSDQKWRIILPRRHWETACRGLLLPIPGSPEHEIAAVGKLRPWKDRNRCEFLVSDVGIERLPDFQMAHPYTRWIVIRCGEDLRLEETWQRLRPRPSQVVAVVLLDPRRMESCQVELFQDGSVQPMGGLDIIGSGMYSLQPVEGSPAESAVDVTNDDNNRYSRLVGALGARVTRQLQSATVTIVGLGRNGSVMASNFAALGVAHLRLIDNDILLPHNLDAMPGLSADSVGKLKTLAVAERLRAFRPNILISQIERTTQDSLEILQRRSDLLVTCVDNDAARFAVSQVAVGRNMVHLDVATDLVEQGNATRLIGDIRLIVPGDGCVCCIGGVDDQSQALYEYSAPVGAMSRGQRRTWNEQRRGSLVTLNGMIVNTAIQHWLDLLGGSLRTSVWTKLSWPSGQSPHFDTVEWIDGEGCRFCRP